MAVKNLLNKQVKDWFNKSAEFEYSANHLYRHLANQMQRSGLFGSQKYFLKESNSELEHFQKLSDYVNDMGDVLGVPAVEATSEEVTRIMGALHIAYNAEYELLQHYLKFYKAAERLDDCATAVFVQDFINIQRQSVGEIADLIARHENNPADVLEFDEYMGELA